MFEQDYASVQDALTTLKTHVDSFAAQEQEIIDAQKQLLTHVIHPDIEYTMPGLNDKPEVGGSGIGTSIFTPADGIKPALFRATPGPIPAGKTDNYYDCYATWKTLPNAAYKNFKMMFSFSFPTSTDMTSASCVEMESRQVLLIGGVRMAAVPGLQANFGSGQLKYFDKAQGWVNSRISLIRQMSMMMGFEAHRDDKTLFYDAIWLSGNRFPVTLQEALYPLNWGDRMSCSIQLDARTSPFSINPSKVSLEVW